MKRASGGGKTKTYWDRYKPGLRPLITTYHVSVVVVLRGVRASRAAGEGASPRIQVTAVVVLRPNANESLPVDEVNEMSKASTSTTLTLDLRSQTISIGGGTKGCAGRRGKLGNENNQGLQLFSRGGGVGGCRIFKSRERVAAGTSGAIGKKNQTPYLVAKSGQGIRV